MIIAYEPMESICLPGASVAPKTHVGWTADRSKASLARLVRHSARLPGDEKRRKIRVRHVPNHQPVTEMKDLEWCS